ncbi:MAG: MBL fold metallo-hydrolase [Candidatus Poseidoniaceae archaeon]|nr:MBL fold metallo-hydrolase [Candidatus Poseidoniaceae archaeon]
MAEVTLLGIAQDGGRPQPSCLKDCCQDIQPSEISFPTSIGATFADGTKHLFDVTRNLGQQLKIWNENQPSHVWLTHAHFGHVDGLGLFGRETIGAKNIKLYASSKMTDLIHATPQWSLMVKQGVFEINTFQTGDIIEFGTESIEPIIIPHRDELSDMHAFIIRGKDNSLLYLPDHDTWEETLDSFECKLIREWLKKYNIDVALIDGTFWSQHELTGRSQKEVPHPPVSQTVAHLGTRLPDDPELYFVHLNHTNPLYDKSSSAHKTVESMGWKVAVQGMKLTL